MSRSLFFFFKFLFKYNCCTRKVDHLFDYFNCPYPDKNRIFIKLCIFRTPDCRKCEICPRVTGCSRLLDAHRVLRPMVWLPLPCGIHFEIYIIKYKHQQKPWPKFLLSLKRRKSIPCIRWRRPPPPQGLHCIYGDAINHVHVEMTLIWMNIEVEWKLESNVNSTFTSGIVSINVWGCKILSSFLRKWNYT